MRLAKTLPRRFTTGPILILICLLVLAGVAVLVAALMTGRLSVPGAVLSHLPEIIYIFAVFCVVGAAQIYPKVSPTLGILLFFVILVLVLWDSLRFLPLKDGVVLFDPLFRSLADLPGGASGFGSGRLPPEVALPYEEQIVVLFLSAIVFGVVGLAALRRDMAAAEAARVANGGAEETAGQGGDVKPPRWFHEALRKPTVLLLVGFLIVALTVFYLFPTLVYRMLLPAAIERQAFLYVHASIPVVAIVVLLAGFFCVDPFRALREGEKSAARPVKPVDQRDVDALFEDLKGDKEARKVGTVSFGDRRNGQREADRGNEGKADLSGRTRRALKAFDVAEGSMDVASLMRALEDYEIARAADVTYKDGLPLKDRLKGLLIEDTLLDYKLVPIAAVMAHHISHGRNVTLVADNRRVKDLVDAIRTALKQFLPESACVWEEAAASAAVPDASPVPKVLWGDCGSVLACTRHVLATNASDDRADAQAFFMHLGLVLVLDLHLLDLLELAQLLRFFDAAGSSQHVPMAQVVLQCEPVQNLKAAAKNSLPSVDFKDDEPLRLSVQPAAGQRTFVWDMAADAEGKSGLDSLLRAIRSRVGLARFIDETREEDRTMWEAAAKGTHEREPLRLELGGLGTYDGARSGCFIDRDRGNLAAALLRDVAAPGSGRGMLVLLSDPSAMRDTLKRGIIWENDKAPPSTVDRDVFASRLVRYLPQLPDVPEGLVEIVQGIALQFLVEQKAIAAAEIAARFQEGMKTRLSDLDLSSVGVADVAQLASAKGLSDLFYLVYARKVSFEQTDPLREPETSDTITCGDLATLGELFFLSGDAGEGLRKVDRGLSYDVGSKFVSRGVLKTVAGINRVGTVTAEFPEEHAEIDSRSKEIFAKTYTLKKVSSKRSRENARVHVGFGIVSYERRTTLKARLKLNSTDGKVPAPEACDAQWSGALSEAVYLRLSCGNATHDQAAAAKALCLTLQDVIDLKFPAVAHRVAVLSRSFEHEHTRIMQVADDIRLNCCRASESQSVWKGFASNVDEDVDQNVVELLVLEDSDTTLGVVDALLGAFRELVAEGNGSPVVNVWREHLQTMAERNGDKRRDGPDWKAASQIMSGLQGGARQ